LFLTFITIKNALEFTYNYITKCRGEATYSYFKREALFLVGKKRQEMKGRMRERSNIVCMLHANRWSATAWNTLQQYSCECQHIVIKAAQIHLH